MTYQRKKSYLIIKMIKNNCSPNRSNNDGSCFKKTELNNMLNVIEKFNPDVKFDLKDNSSKKQLWNSVRIGLSKIANPDDWKKCNNEECWPSLCIKKNGKKCTIKFFDLFENKEEAFEMMMFVFKPKKPEGELKSTSGSTVSDVWLSTFDIVFVLKQYEKVYDNFIFFGPIPGDTLDCFKNKNWCKTTTDPFLKEFKKIDFKNLKKNGKTKIGISINLDDHDGPGTHWVAMFIDLEINTIEYFDSYGLDKIACNSNKFTIKFETPKKIKGLIEHFSEKYNLTSKINRYRHQYSDSQCGIYSIYFIVERLAGKSFEEITEKCIPDSKMKKYRNIFYRSS